MAGERTNSLATGARYFIEGVRWLAHPRLRKYILIPLIVNGVLFLLLTWLFISLGGEFFSWNWNLPAWLDFLEKILKWVAWLVIAIILLIAYGYSFNVITTIIAAPFYGVLAQQTEALMTGVPPPDEPWGRMIPRVIWRELVKLSYFIIRGLLVILLIVLLGTLLVLGVFAPVVGGLWSAWCMAIQYVDYPADNHQTPFRRLRKKLRRPLYSSVGFGGAVMLATIVPIVNIFVGPAAVIGGTIFWLRELQDDATELSVAGSSD